MGTRRDNEFSRRKAHFCHYIDDWLNTLGLYRKIVPFDETCLFRAVAEQLFLSQNFHKRVRSDCIEYCRKNTSEVMHLFKTEEHLEDYLQKLGEHMVICGHRELVLVCEAYQCNAIVYKSDTRSCAYIPGIKHNHRDKILSVCQIEGDHFDVIYEKPHVDNMGFCQSIIYEILYENVLALDSALEISKLMLSSEAQVQTPGHHKENSLTLISREEKRREFVEANNCHDDLEILKATSIAPFPYKVAKALDPYAYRNIEYDTWVKIRREIRFEEWYHGDGNFVKGTRCFLLENEEKLECYIQEIFKERDECVVYVTSKVQRRTVKFSDLFPEEDAKPWPVPYRFCKNMEPHRSAKPPDTRRHKPKRNTAKNEPKTPKLEEIGPASSTPSTSTQSDESTVKKDQEPNSTKTIYESPSAFTEKWNDENKMNFERKTLNTELQNPNISEVEKLEDNSDTSRTDSNGSMKHSTPNKGRKRFPTKGRWSESEKKKNGQTSTEPHGKIDQNMDSHGSDNSWSSHGSGMNQLQWRPYPYDYHSNVLVAPYNPSFNQNCNYDFNGNYDPRIRPNYGPFCQNYDPAFGQNVPVFSQNYNPASGQNAPALGQNYTTVFNQNFGPMPYKNYNPAWSQNYPPPMNQNYDPVMTQNYDPVTTQNYDPIMNQNYTYDPTMTPMTQNSNWEQYYYGDQQFYAGNQTFAPFMVFEGEYDQNYTTGNEQNGPESGYPQPIPLPHGQPQQIGFSCSGLSENHYYSNAPNDSIPADSLNDCPNPTENQNHPELEEAPGSALTEQNSSVVCNSNSDSTPESCSSDDFNLPVDNNLPVNPNLSIDPQHFAYPTSPEFPHATYPIPPGFPYSISPGFANNHIPTEFPKGIYPIPNTAYSISPGFSNIAYPVSPGFPNTMYPVSPAFSTASAYPFSPGFVFVPVPVPVPVSTKETPGSDNNNPNGPSVEYVRSLAPNDAPKSNSRQSNQSEPVFKFPEIPDKNVKCENCQNVSERDCSKVQTHSETPSGHNFRSKSEHNLQNQSRQNFKIESEHNVQNQSRQNLNTESEQNLKTESELNIRTQSEQNFKTQSEQNFKTQSEQNSKTHSERNFITRSEQNFNTQSEQNIQNQSGQHQNQFGQNIQKPSGQNLQYQTSKNMQNQTGQNVRSQSGHKNQTQSGRLTRSDSRNETAWLHDVLEIGSPNSERRSTPENDSFSITPTYRYDLNQNFPVQSNPPQVYQNYSTQGQDGYQAENHSGRNSQIIPSRIHQNAPYQNQGNEHQVNQSNHQASFKDYQSGSNQFNYRNVAHQPAFYQNFKSPNVTNQKVNSPRTVNSPNVPHQNVNSPRTTYQNSPNASHQNNSTNASYQDMKSPNLMDQNANYQNQNHQNETGANAMYQNTNHRISTNENAYCGSENQNYRNDQNQNYQSDQNQNDTMNQNPNYRNNRNPNCQNNQNSNYQVIHDVNNQNATRQCYSNHQNDEDLKKAYKTAQTNQNPQTYQSDPAYHNAPAYQNVPPCVPNNYGPKFPTRQNSPSIHENLSSLHKSPSPIQQKLPPIQQKLPPIQQVAVQQKFPPIQQNLPPIQQNVLPIQHNVPPIQHNVPPIQQNLPLIQQKLPPIQQNLAPLFIPCSPNQIRPHFPTPNGIPPPAAHTPHPYPLAPIQTNATSIQTYPNPVQTYSNPVQTHPNPVQTYPNPVQTDSNHIQSYSNPVQTDSNHVQTYPNPVQTYPTPVKTNLTPIHKNPTTQSSINSPGGTFKGARIHQRISNSQPHTPRSANHSTRTKVNPNVFIYPGDIQSAIVSDGVAHQGINRPDQEVNKLDQREIKPDQGVNRSPDVQFVQYSSIPMPVIRLQSPPKRKKKTSDLSCEPK